MVYLYGIGKKCHNIIHTNRYKFPEYYVFKSHEYQSTSSFKQVLHTWKTYPQCPDPLFGQLWSATNSFVPHNRKVYYTAEVLCDSYCVIKVDDHMPPASRNKHSLTRFLENLKLKSHH